MRRAVALAAVLGTVVVAPEGVEAAAPSPAEAPRDWPPRFTVTELVGPNGEAFQSRVEINERGQVAATMGSNAILWDRGTTTILNPEGTQAMAVEISDRGQVVGIRSGSFVPWPFSWSQGAWTQLTPDEVGGIALDVNERGQVLVYRAASDVVVWDDGEVAMTPVEAGVMSTKGEINDRGQAVVQVGSGAETVAAVWQVGGEVTELGTLGGLSSQGLANNDSGHVAGTSITADGEQHAFLWHRGEMVDLGTLGGATSDVGSGELHDLIFLESEVLNERGHVAGTSETSTGERHAVLWRGGEMVDLGTLGGSNSYASAINNRDQVVGASQTASQEWHAFLWQDGRMVDLGALTGEGFSRATDINDRGRIVGITSTGAVMWTARPTHPDEPSD